MDKQISADTSHRKLKTSLRRLRGRLRAGLAAPALSSFAFAGHVDECEMIDDVQPWFPQHSFRPLWPVPHQNQPIQNQVLFEIKLRLKPIGLFRSGTCWNRPEVMNQSTSEHTSTDLVSAVLIN